MLCSLLLTTLAAPGSLMPFQMRCEALVNPIGVGTTAPRLSWKLAPKKANSYSLSQSGYRIRVGKEPGMSDLWDSGVVKSSTSFDIKYKGKALASGQQCFWSVQVIDQNGNASEWSKPAKWSVGLLKPSDWKAQWIGFDKPTEIPKGKDPLDGAQWIWGQSDTVYFARQADVKAGFKTVSMIATADDQFSITVNGKSVAKSDGNTDAWRRPVKADVTKFFIGGENTISVKATNTGDGAGFIASFLVTYPNGETKVLKTDQFWRVSDSENGSFGTPKVVANYGGSPWGTIGTKTLVLPAPRYLRSEFNLNKPVKRVTLYGSALGLLDLRVNGAEVTDELFMPGWTDYTKRVYARGYDVTGFVKRGANAVGVVLGDGWYAGYVGFGGVRQHYGKKTRAIVQFDIEYMDGTRESVGSNPNWKASTGPTLEGDFLMGETYDARLEKAGWDKPGYNAAGWSKVDTGTEFKTNLEPFPGQPVRPYQRLKAKSISEVKPDTYVLDLGQNMAGFAGLRIRGTKGQKITLRFAERLSPDKTVYTTNLRSARTIDTYICKGGGIETWTPKFTFHGFQYIEVTGLGHKPTADEIVGIAISSDTPNTGTIETSDKMINQLVSNAWWTQRMNFIDIPTDCPQRDERLGWTGDAQAYVRTASMLTDVQPFFTKWLVTLDDGQREDGQFPTVAPVKVSGPDGGPAWADAGVICPWTIYDVYGDKELLARHYPQMKKFIEFCVNRSTSDLLPPKNFHCFGDWLSINANTPNEVIYTAYFAGSTRLVAKAARELGKLDEAAHYDNLYKRVSQAFVKEYVAADGTVKGDTQCGYILALAFDLLDNDLAKKAADKLVSNIEKRGWHLSTGFVGTRDIMNVLSKIGRNDVAYRLLHNTTFPSWGFTIVNGATSIWERWDGWTPDKGFQDAGMNSFAHYAFGAVVGWMFDQPAGIRNLTPGFTSILVAPQIDENLKWLRSSYDSVQGKIVSDWAVKNGKLTMKVIVPPNAQAEIHVPAIRTKASPAIPAAGSVRGATVYKVSSGEYTFTGTLRE